MVGCELFDNIKEDFIMTTGVQWTIIEPDFQFEE